MNTHTHIRSIHTCTCKCMYMGVEMLECGAFRASSDNRERVIIALSLILPTLLIHPQDYDGCCQRDDDDQYPQYFPLVNLVVCAVRTFLKLLLTQR